MSMICDMLAANLTTLQNTLATDTTSQLENTTDIALASATLLANDTGAPVPLTMSTAGQRITDLLAQNPVNFALVTQYYALVGLMISALGWANTIATDNANIATVQAEQVVNGC